MDTLSPRSGRRLAALAPTLSGLAALAFFLFGAVPGVAATEAAASPAYVPLTWPDAAPPTQFVLPDGTLETEIGGRVRDRHARESFSDNYAIFGAHYFERRTNDITIYENVAPADPAARVLTI